jgi:hypothetical protein
MPTMVKLQRLIVKLFSYVRQFFWARTHEEVFLGPYFVLSQVQVDPWLVTGLVFRNCPIRKSILDSQLGLRFLWLSQLQVHPRLTTGFIILLLSQLQVHTPTRNWDRSFSISIASPPSVS